MGRHINVIADLAVSAYDATTFDKFCAIMSGFLSPLVDINLGLADENHTEDENLLLKIAADSSVRFLNRYNAANCKPSDDESTYKQFREDCLIDQLVEAAYVVIGTASSDEKQVDPLSPIIYRYMIKVGDEEEVQARAFVEGRPYSVLIQPGMENNFVQDADDLSRFSITDESDIGELSSYLGSVLGESFTVVEEPSPKPYQYILMRMDVDSMNPGKAVAQGVHAGNQMVYEITNHTGDFSTIFLEMLREWETEANGFGTCVVLGASEKQMRDAVKVAQDDELPSPAGICHDSSYPLRDGAAFHQVPLDTCAYIFDYPARVRQYVTGLGLMP